MSNYSMSPPQKPAPRPYSPPYSNQGSPVNPPPYGQPPAAKRQRLSPDARSPMNGTAPSGYAMPPQGQQMSYGNPYAAHGTGMQSPAPYNHHGSPPAYASSPPSASFNTPQPYYHPQQPAPWQPHGPVAPPNRQNSPPNPQSSQMMPPPPRPNKEEKEERVGVDEIGDSLFGSGINIKDEENYLHSTFNNRHGANDSFNTNPSTSSFASSTMSPNNSFNLLTQSTSFSGSQPSGAQQLAGTLEPAPRSQEDVERDQIARRERAARERNERMQHHLANQFLLANGVRARLEKRAREAGINWNVEGLYRRQDPPQTHTMVNGAGSEGLAAVDSRPEYTVGRGSHVDQLLSLLSLAAGERLRSLLSEAHGIARARRYGDHGRIPPEFADVAVGGVGAGKSTEETVVPENVTGSEWDRIPSDNANNDDQSSSEPQGEKQQPLSTLSFSSAIAARLLDLAVSDREAEKLRLEKRAARRRAENNDPNNPSSDTNPSSTTDKPADAIAPVTKVSKKELAKREKEAKNSSEANMHVSTNQTAAMMALGKKASRYSWMQGARAQPLVNRFQKAAERAAGGGGGVGGGSGSAGGSGTATPEATVSGGAGVASPGGGNPAATATKAAGAGVVNGVSPSSGTGAAGGNATAAAEEEAQWGEWREDGPGGAGIQTRDWITVLERDGREKIALQRVWTALKS